MSINKSFEAINVQINSPLFKELCIHTEELKNTINPVKADGDAFLKAMESSIFAHSGIKVTLGMHESRFPNAWVIVPMIDKNHPLMNDYWRRQINNKDGLKLVKKNNGLFKGGVDREKAKVSGTFSEINVKMFVTLGLLMSDDFTSEEVSAIILHEIGHVFTYLEYLGTNITTNYVLQHVSRELTGNRELKRKYEVVKDAEEALGIKIGDVDALVRTEREEVITTVVLREVYKSTQNELGSKTYDMTAWEMLSDQFSSRHGAGRSLVTALDKMYRKYGADEFKSTTGYLVSEAFKFLMFVVGSVVTLGIITILSLFVIDPMENIYDKPKSRIDRIKRDMIDATKNKNADKDYQKKLVADIEVIDLILKEMTERRTLLELFWTTVHPRTRNNYEQLRFQQELEMLVNNELFVKAAKLRTLNA